MGNPDRGRSVEGGLIPISRALDVQDGAVYLGIIIRDISPLSPSFPLLAQATQPSQWRLPYVLCLFLLHWQCFSLSLSLSGA